jgi:hypothetical protein
MSYTCFYGSKNGEWELIGQIRNSWHWYVNVWLSLWEEYTKDKYGKLYLNVNDKDISKVWGLASNKNVPEFEKAVLNSTFDKTIIRRSSIPWLIEQIEKFENKYPNKTNAKKMIVCFENIMTKEKLKEYENILICTSIVLYEGRLKINHSRCNHERNNDADLECESSHDDNRKLGELLSLIEGETFFEIKDATVNPDYDGVVVYGDFATI